MSPTIRILACALLALAFVGAPPRAVAQSDEAAEVRVSRNLDRKLRRDAARLALRLREGEDLRFQAVQIPPREMAALYDALLTMYKVDEGVRSIFRCNVHTRPDPSIDRMLVIFDRSIDWAQPLREGRHETTSARINDLLYDHDLIIEKHLQWDDTHDAISVRSKKPLNMASLANEFYNVDGVREIDLGITKELGNDITATRVASGWRFSFELNFGSLAEEGEQVHRWLYEVSAGGHVARLSESGQPVPEWMRCANGDALAPRQAAAR